MVIHTWTAGLSKEEAAALVRRLKDSEEVFLRLSYILDQRLKDSVNKQMASQSYDKPSWPYFQADCVGYQRAMKEILTLITERK